MELYNNITQEFNNLFKQLNEILNNTINTIECKPIQIQKNLYLTGIKRIGTVQVNVHLKKLKTITIPTLTFNQNIQTLQDESDEEIFIDVQLLEINIIKDALNKLKKQLLNENNRNNLIIVTTQYKPKDEQQNNYCTKEENFLFDDKHIAYKTILKKRKESQLFKSKFIHLDNNNNIIQNNKQTITDEEFANMPLE